MPPARRIITLTEADKRRLRELDAAVKNLPRNPTNLPSVIEPDPTAPEVYVAIIPDGGMPARLGTIPGSAECTIYRFDQSVDPAQLQALDFTKRVYNVFTSEIAAGEYVIVGREKFGVWVVQITSSADVTTAGHTTEECGCPISQTARFYVSGGSISQSQSGLVEVTDSGDPTGSSQYPQSPLITHGAPTDPQGYPSAVAIDVDNMNLYYWEE